MKEIEKQPFICPYCKQETGFQEETPIRGRYNQEFDEKGNIVFGEYVVSTEYTASYTCCNCGRGITKAVQKYLSIYEEEKRKTERRRLKRKLNKIKKIQL